MKRRSFNSRWSNSLRESYLYIQTNRKFKKKSLQWIVCCYNDKTIFFFKSASSVIDVLKSTRVCAKLPSWKSTWCKLTKLKSTKEMKWIYMFIKKKRRKREEKPKEMKRKTMQHQCVEQTNRFSGLSHWLFITIMTHDQRLTKQNSQSCPNVIQRPSN